MTAVTEAKESSMGSIQKRILVVDDDPVVLDYVSKILTDSGFKVFTTDSGAEAIQIVNTTEIDLAILDFRMPGLSGLDVGREIHRLASTRFILMSRLSDRDLITQAAQDGALQFLPKKPLERSDLLNSVTIGLARAAEIKGTEKSLKDLKDNFNEAVARGIAAARIVNTAIGILMERYRKVHRDAYDILMRLTNHQHRRAVDISEELIKEAEAEYRRASD